MSFLNIMLCYHFSLEAVLQSMAKNNPTETNRSKNSKATLKHSMNTDRKENVKFIVTNFNDRFTSYITTSYPNMFSVMFKVFCYFEHMFFCWKKYSTKNHCCSNPKIPCPGNKYLLKVAAETLKEEVKSVKSQQ